jgi:HEAT repeat protein
LGDLQAVPALAEKLKVEDVSFRVTIVKALRDIGSALSSKLKKLDSKRRTTTGGQLERENIINILSAAFKKNKGRKYDEVRVAIAEALGNIGGPHAVPALLVVLNDRESLVAKAAATALGKTRDLRAVSHLAAKATEEKRSTSSVAIAEALGELGYFLRNASKGRDLNEKLKISVAAHIEKINNALLKLLNHKNINVRAAAAETLLVRGDLSELEGKIEEPEKALWAYVLIARKEEQSLPTSEMLTQSQEMQMKFTRQAAMAEKKWTGLVTIGPPAIPALLMALKDPENFYRQKAAEALGEIGDRRTIKPLWTALRRKKEKDNTCFMIAYALIAIGGEEEEGRLKKFIQDRPEPALWKARILELIGEKQMAISMLKALLQKESLKEDDVLILSSGERIVRGVKVKERQERIATLVSMTERLLIEVLSSDPDPRARMDAARFLGQNGSAETHAALTEAMKKERVGRVSAEITKAQTKIAARLAKEKESDGKEEGGTGTASSSGAWVLGAEEVYNNVHKFILENPKLSILIGIGVLTGVIILYFAIRRLIYRISPVRLHLKMIRHKKPDRRKAAVEALGELGPVNGKVIPALIKALDDEDKEVCLAAIKAVGGVDLSENQKNSVAQILAMLAIEDESEDVRTSSARLLGKLGSSRVKLVADKMEDPEPEVRVAAIEALGEMTSSAITIFLPTLK